MDGAKAKVTYRRVWVAGVGLVLALLGLVAALRPASKDPHALWAEAFQGLQEGNLEVAEARLAEISRLRKPTSLDHCLEAQVALARGRPEEALSSLNVIPDTDPAAPQALLLKGRIERQQNRARPAEAAFRKALAINPRFVEARRELIYLLGMQLRRREVDAEFKLLARLKPLTHRELYVWGLTHFNSLRSPGAGDTSDHLQAFIAADPEDRSSRLALAATLLKSPEMENVVEQTLAPLPASDPEAIALRVELKLANGKIDDAMAMLQNAPQDHPLLSRLQGRAALARGDRDAAIRYFREALSDEPYDRVSPAELGRALASQGNQAEAEPYLNRARRLDEVYNLLDRIRRPERENQPSDLVRLGASCEAAGLLEESRGWYLLAIERDAFNTEAQRGLAGLRTSLNH
jgi:tetratricopeptide (TPR) repeat protein